MQKASDLDLGTQGGAHKLCEMLPLSVDGYPHGNSSSPLGLKTKPNQIPNPPAVHEPTEGTIFTQVLTLVALQLCHKGCHMLHTSVRVREGLGGGLQ